LEHSISVCFGLSGLFRLILQDLLRFSVGALVPM
jgi:hypothetical protein